MYSSKKQLKNDIAETIVNKEFQKNEKIDFKKTMKKIYCFNVLKNKKLNEYCVLKICQKKKGDESPQEKVWWS